MEFASSMFADEDSVKKVAALVKAYIDMGGHQMQLNAIQIMHLHTIILVDVMLLKMKI